MAPTPLNRTRSRHLANLLTCLSVLAVGCGTHPARRPPSAPTTAADTARRGVAPAAGDTSATRDTLAPAHPAPAPPRYAAIALAGPRTLSALQDSLGAARFADVLALNRIDLAHARQGDSLVVPVAADSLLALSPFPPRLAALDTLPRALLVSVRVQAWAAYRRDTLVRWGPVSTGRRAKPTPVGLYHTNWRQKQRLSTVDDSWLLKWYVNLESREGVSFHEYELPGRPASHSCVRLRPEDAEWIYRWCETWTLSADRRSAVRPGTPVVVFGAYAWGHRRPWKRLPADPTATTLAPAELDEALAILRAGTRPAFAPDSSAR